MGVVGYYHPAVKTAGFKMIDVIGSQCFMIFVRAENLSEKGVLKFPERNVPRCNKSIIPFFLI